jgi:methylase of polypeptide subunit release factors
METSTQQALGALLRAVASTGYEFVPPTPETHRRVNSRPGNEEARNLRDIFGWSRPFRRELAGETIFRLLEQANALDPVGDLWKSTVRIATLGGRHFLHTAYPTTAPDAVFFGPDTYRFVRAGLAVVPERRYARAVDLGCGSGAGGLSMAANRDIGALFLTDINPAALALAKINADHAAASAHYVESDLFGALDGAFDLILANPPYLADPGKRAYRDGGGPLGLDLGLRILRDGLDRLAPGGALFLYTGVPIADGIDPLLQFARRTIPRTGYRFDYGEIDPDVFGEELERPDYANIDRIAAVALTVFRSQRGE